MNSCCHLLLRSNPVNSMMRDTSRLGQAFRHITVTIESAQSYPCPLGCVGSKKGTLVSPFSLRVVSTRKCRRRWRGTNNGFEKFPTRGSPTQTGRPIGDMLIAGPPTAMWTWSPTCRLRSPTCCLCRGWGWCKCHLLYDTRPLLWAPKATGQWPVLS